ncbi:MAG: glycoside hydrolase family 31 protein [Anaerolineales bacterium]|jgi:alpha-glucosidase
MNLLQQFLIGVRFMGLRATLRTLSYSRYRDRTEKRFGVASRQKRKPPCSPEVLQEVKPFHNGAFFTFNHRLRLEVAFLSTTTVRITWTPGKDPVPYAVSGGETIALQVWMEEKQGGYTLTAGSLQVHVSQDGQVRYFSGGKSIRSDFPPVHEAPAWTHEAKLDEDSAIYGLGERTRFNLRPGDYSFWNQDPGGSYGLDADPLYLTIPLYFCQQEKGSYLAFYENTFDGQANFGDRARMHFVGGAVRLYVIEGDLAQTLGEYRRLTGSSPMPPKWSLGFQQCRWGYRTEEDVREVLAGFEQHDLPLEVFHFDIDYMDGYRVFSVDPYRFAKFDQLCAEMNDAGIKPVVILDPGVKADPNFGVYSSGEAEEIFCKLPDGKSMRGLVWPGWVHFPDFTNPVTRRWWGEYYQRFLEDGVAGFWHDMNEPASFAAFGETTFPRVTHHQMEGRGGSHEEAHNVYGLLMNRAGFEAMRKFQPDKRPWILTRSGWAGVQRYAWKWTADVESTWSALKMTISTVLGLGVSGIPYSGSDIGGFSGNPDAELYTRWFQMSALMALFRNHAAVATERREPWVYGERYTDICREMMRLRLCLMPYLYTLAWEAHQTGAPLARPVFWNDHDNTDLWTVDDAYLLGDSMLVAPVVEAGAVTRSVILPTGGWYHYWDDRYYSGGRYAEVKAPLERIPVFIKEGTILPQEDDGQLALHIYLPTKELVTHSIQYSDAGDGYGSSRVDRYRMEKIGQKIFVGKESDGDYPVEEKIRLVFHGGGVSRLTADGSSLEVVESQVELPPFKSLQFGLE